MPACFAPASAAWDAAMCYRIIRTLVAVLLLSTAVFPSLLLHAVAFAESAHSDMGRRARHFIEAGAFAPLYGTESADKKLQVESFYLDDYPVTNGDFYRFIRERKEWKKPNVPALLADERYLAHWVPGEGKERAPGTPDMKRPVVNVSWFAAADYCAAQGGRLPTVLEWEYAAAASEDKRDASRDPEFVQKLLAWYAAPGGSLAEVGRGKPNAWGVHDLHGLVWEWTNDFNSIFVAGDNRRDSEQLKNLFCGNGSTSSTDRANYAAFMRYAMRNSLQGHFTTENLGFRCAYDEPRRNGTSSKLER